MPLIKLEMKTLATYGICNHPDNTHTSYYQKSLNFSMLSSSSFVYLYPGILNRLQVFASDGIPMSIMQENLFSKHLHTRYFSFIETISNSLFHFILSLLFAPVILKSCKLHILTKFFLHLVPLNERNRNL